MLFRSIGNMLKAMLDESNIAVDYFVDKNAAKMEEKVSIIPLTNNMPKVDLLIVSLPNYYHEIIDQLHEYGISKYILVDEIVSELGRSCL